MDKNEFLNLCQTWYEDGDAYRRIAEGIINAAEDLGYSVRYYRSGGKSKKPRGDIVAAFGIGGCEMLCIRGYNPSWRRGIQFVHRAKPTQLKWKTQSELFASTWKHLASTPDTYPDGKISFRDEHPVGNASKALAEFAEIMAKHPTP